MARKMMTKEVTKTTIKLGKIEMVDGSPTLVFLPDEIVLGNCSPEKAQKLMNKKHGEVTVLEVIPDTNVYEMEVERFIELAELKDTEKEGK